MADIYSRDPESDIPRIEKDTGLLDAAGNIVRARVVALQAGSTAAVTGQAAHDAAITGAPVRVGARALTANYAAVATGDTADLISTLVGAVIQKPFSIPEADWSYVAAAGGIVNTTVAVTLKTQPGAGIRNYLTALQICADALTNATELVINNGAAGPVIWRMKIPVGGLPSLHVTFPSPLKSSAAQLLEVQTLTASGGGAVYVNAQGYTAP